MASRNATTRGTIVDEFSSDLSRLQDIVEEVQHRSGYVSADAVEAIATGLSMHSVENRKTWYRSAASLNVLFRALDVGSVEVLRRVHCAAVVVPPTNQVPPNPIRRWLTSAISADFLA